MSKVYPDISHHHPVSDWDKIEKNCPFIITKATQGTSFVDSTLDKIIKQCESRGIPYWLYVYLNKGGEEAQARFMVKTCKGKIGKHFVGYCLDVEAGNTAGGVKKALSYLEGLGYKCMVYTMYSQFASYRSVINAKGSNTAWWEARYGKNNGSYSSKYPCHAGVDLHQFTEYGSCPGIKSKIDLNRLTGLKSEEWFKTPLSASTQETETGKKAYSGKFPTLPERGYFKQGDGYKTLTDAASVAEIKVVQTFLNWAAGSKLAIDGSYGLKTVAAVEDFQMLAGVAPDGKFGKKSLAKAKTMKK